jgi:hypothetical protein
MARNTATPPRRNHYHDSDPVARDLALRWGMRVGSVHQLLYGRDRLDGRTVDVIEAFQRHGAEARGARWTAPIRAALAGVAIDPLTRQLLRDAQRADLAEDEAENDYRLAESPESARRWVQKIDELVSWLLRLRTSLVARHNLDDEH